MSTWTCKINTPVGEFAAKFTAAGLCELRFPRQQRGATTRSTAPLQAIAPRKIKGWTNATRRAVLSILSGKTPDTLPPLDLSNGTRFQRKVWMAIAEIPPGQTRTYSQLAARIGHPKASRAVGQACGANPIPLLIPCHRVLPATGGWGGFSAGARWKRLLLERESATPGWRRVSEAPRQTDHACGVGKPVAAVRWCLCDCAPMRNELFACRANGV
ncbi:MAG: methylated-DNA--[protein]-cysteine S-methyltransferase [Verrucomicrobiota bacterium]|nr:methylated-DNA--[protein]-cysteine S-methyltransferase [Verrucomicrobiota bacterium]